MMAGLQVGTTICNCNVGEHSPRLVVLTGGPGGGKTAVLEMARQLFCEHVGFLPEAAGIVFGGGFPRDASNAARRAAQRAIHHVQREMEELVLEEKLVAVALCDRGTVDGLAYWPGDEASYWNEFETTLEVELGKYAAVIHLETPGVSSGYNHDNKLRIENASEAQALDKRIANAWSKHPRRFVVSSTEDFLEKAVRALTVVRGELPHCCHTHAIPSLGDRV